MRAIAGCLIGLALAACNDDTGSGLVQFTAHAAGPRTAVEGEPYEFDSAMGYHVRLERARLTIGAIYLNRSRPTLGAQEIPCVLPGVYVGEVTSGVVIDALSPTPSEFGIEGRGTSSRALTAEVWLTGGRVDAERDTTKILDFAGLATKGDLAFGFHGHVTIGENRAAASADPATPSANPLCKLRIVTPIAVDITPSQGGDLAVRVAPEVWFDHVEFSQLPSALGRGEELEFPDSNENPASLSLFQGLRTIDAYRLEWTP